MILLYEILGSVIAQAACQGVVASPRVASAVVQWFREWGPKSTAQQIRELLDQIGHSSEQHIRGLVEEWLERNPEHGLDPAQVEDLNAVLVNLAKNARFHGTQGRIRSSIVRNARLLEQLLSDVQPKRRRGESVAPGCPDWTLERFLGMGTFGEVWMATNPLVDAPRAFKFFTDGQSLRWVKDEAQVMKRTHRKIGSHPNIVQCHDVAVMIPENPYIALEYVDGGSLEDWIVEDEGHRVALDRSEVMRQIIAAVAAAHRSGIRHRDLKPANIVLTSERPVQPKVTDFGLGGIANQATMSMPSLTSQAAVVGTAMYLPPEADAMTSGFDEAKQDVFALGVIWYQLLTGRIERPAYDFADELRQAGVDSHTIRVISRCLARPERRFPDADELERGLAEMPPDSWNVPEGMFDVSHLFREYHARQAG